MTPDPEFESLVPAQSFDRRSFLVTSLGAGFALAMQPVMAQTVIQTDTTGLLAGEVKVPVKDGEMVAYRATPAGKAKPPVVLVVSEIFGVHEYIKDTCRRLAKAGYCAVAPELFARQGDPRQYTSIAGTPRQDHQQDAGCPGHERPRRHRRLGGEAGWRHGPPGDHRLLLGRPHHLAVLRPQSAGQGRRRLVRAA